MKKVVLGSTAMLAVILLAVGLGLFATGTQKVNAAMAEFSVRNMTCGSCVGTIEDALGRLDGIEQVDIVVSTGRSQVLYNPAQLDAQTIAKTITDSGFPATVQLVLSSEDYQALQSEESRLGETYLARVGTRLIPREEFDKRVNRTLATMQFKDKASADREIRASLWQEVLQREILLSAAEQNQVVVHPGEVDRRMEELNSATPDFEAAVLSKYGDRDQFVRQLKEDMVIKRNIELNVIAGIESPQEQRQKLNQWFQQLSQQTSVVIFDQQLKQAAASSASGCGSGCCSS